MPEMATALKRWWFALLPAVVTLLLGLWGLGTPAPWLDELFTIEAVTEGLSSHFWDAPMLPYYAFMWSWTLAGNVIDDAWLRLPSVLSMATAAAAASVAARRLSTVPAGFTAGMLLAIAPGVSRYAQEARTYAPAAALVAIATLALVVAMTGGGRRWWFVYGGALGLAAIVLPMSLAAIPAHAVILRSAPAWRTLGRDWLAACLFLVPIAAVDALLAVWFGGTRAWLQPPGVSNLPEAVSLIGNSEYTGVGGTAFAVVLVVLAALSRIGLRWLAGLAVSVMAVFVLSVTAGSWLDSSLVYAARGHPVHCRRPGTGAGRLGTRPGRSRHPCRGGCPGTPGNSRAGFARPGRSGDGCHH